MQNIHVFLLSICFFLYKINLLFKKKNRFESNKNASPSDNGLVYSNNFTHDTELLFRYLGILYLLMIYPGFCPASFICANIIPITKGSIVKLSDSDKYRSIAISSILGKFLDIIIVKPSDALTTSQHQYGFKANSSTVHWAPEYS